MKIKNFVLPFIVFAAFAGPSFSEKAPAVSYATIAPRLDVAPVSITPLPKLGPIVIPPSLDDMERVLKTQKQALKDAEKELRTAQGMPGATEDQRKTKADAAAVAQNNINQANSSIETLNQKIKEKKDADKLTAAEKKTADKQDAATEKAKKDFAAALTKAENTYEKNIKNIKSDVEKAVKAGI
ncbi:MAG: hypothetical protein LBK26_03340 [Rickettsiales bacterium]|nr:hypothetical protein [Rickettsiales bacterium]